MKTPRLATFVGAKMNQRAGDDAVDLGELRDVLGLDQPRHLGCFPRRAFHPPQSRMHACFPPQTRWAGPSPAYVVSLSTVAPRRNGARQGPATVLRRQELLTARGDSRSPGWKRELVTVVTVVTASHGGCAVRIR